MLVNLMAEMQRFGIRYEDLAKTIGKTVRAVKNRINGECEISSEEIKAIRDAYFKFYTLDYLLEESPCIVSAISDKNGNSLNVIKPNASQKPA